MRSGPSPLISLPLGSHPWFSHTAGMTSPCIHPPPQSLPQQSDQSRHPRCPRVQICQSADQTLSQLGLQRRSHQRASQQKKPLLKHQRKSSLLGSPSNNPGQHADAAKHGSKRSGPVMKFCWQRQQQGMCGQGAIASYRMRVVAAQ